MRAFQMLIGLGLAVALLAGAAEAAKGGGKKSRGARGTVETITSDSLTVKVQRGKKNGGQAVDQVFQIKPETQFEFVTIKKHAKGEKPEMETSAATLGDVKPGEMVRIASASAGSADKISIIQRAAKKNAN